MDGDNYALIGKYKRKVRRLIGVDDNNLEPEDSLNIQLPMRRYERLRNRTEDEDLLINRHWFEGLTFDPVRDQFDDLYYQRSLTLERSEFEAFDGGRPECMPRHDYHHRWFCNHGVGSDPQTVWAGVRLPI